jgi:protein MpaA
LVELIRSAAPAAILSAHSFNRYQVNVNGPARAWGEALAGLCHYPVTEDIGYPTPGCLGTYAGRELGIPTITLEIERGLSREAVIALHLPVMREALLFWEKWKGN